MATFERSDEQRRRRIQAAYIDMLLANGPLRDGLTADDAAATFSTLANPNTYDLLVTRRGWTPDHYETWLADSITRLLLPCQT